MSVPNQTPYNIYTANGLTTVFPYEFYLLNAGDLAVSLNGSVITSGYTISGVGNVDGGEVLFLTPPANGVTVMLERMIPTYRLTDYQDNGDLLADTVNKDFDRLWMAIQQAFIYWGLALTRPLLGGPFNAKWYRIEQLSDPINGQDAATKNYVDLVGQNNLRNVLRFPDAVEPMPAAKIRAHSLQGYTNEGKPVPVFSITDTGDLALKLASTIGAQLVGVEPRGTVQDAIRYATPEMFGIKLQSRLSSSFIDYTDQFQALVNYCVSNSIPLVSHNTQHGTAMYSDLGIYVTRPIDLTGLREMHGNVTIYVNGNVFYDPTNIGVAVRAYNASFDSQGRYIPGSTNGNINWSGSLEVVNLSSRSGSVQGMRLTFTRSRVGRLKAYGFIGRGVHLACCYDSHIDIIEAERCGDITRFAVEVSTHDAMAGADESNALTIGGLMAHDSYEKAWLVVGSKLRLLRVHEELTIVTTNPSSPKPIETRTGYGRLNSYFSSVGGGIGNVSVDPLSTNPLPHVHGFGAVDTSADTLGSPRGIVVLMSGDPASFGGTVGVIYTKTLSIIEGARCTINRVEIVDEFTGGDYDTVINGGFITNVKNNICRVANVTIRNSFSIQPLRSTSYISCQFNGSPKFNGIRAFLQNCTIAGDLTVNNSFRAEFSNSRIQSVNIVGTDVDIVMSTVNVPGNFNISDSATGVWLLSNVRIDGTKSPWRLPTVAPWIGARTSNPDPRPGEGVDFTFTAGGWAQLTTRGS
ncbi:hypothetical protein I5L29_02540 [Serratia marcescens]|nr:hypothetical protein [Serratia marcescens]